MLAANGGAFSPQHVTQHSASGKRVFEVQFVDAAHDRQVDPTGWLRSVVRRRACQ
jgi:hypothetical protein